MRRVEVAAADTVRLEAEREGGATRFDPMHLHQRKHRFRDGSTVWDLRAADQDSFEVATRRRLAAFYDLFKVLCDEIKLCGGWGG